MPTVPVYHVGDLVRIESWDDTNVGFTNESGVLTDPTTVTLLVETPAGTVTAYTYALAQVTKLSAGKFYKDIIPDAGGEWCFRWVGTGAVQAAAQGTFAVRSEIPVAP